MSRPIFWLPLAIALVVLVGLFGGALLSPSERTVPSALVGQPVPDFALPPPFPGRPGLSSEALKAGEPRVVNIFASWCIPCRVEAPQLEALARRGIPVDGIAVRDRPQDLAAFLAQ